MEEVVLQDAKVVVVLNVLVVQDVILVAQGLAKLIVLEWLQAHVDPVMDCVKVAKVVIMDAQVVHRVLVLV